jgi:membrane protease YdiL (CAAX protease family)
MIAGIAVIVGSVALVEWAGRALLEKTQWGDGTINLLIGLLESALSPAAYILLYKNYERRSITEFSAVGFPKNAAGGFLTGLLLQSLFIAVLFLCGGYAISATNALGNVVNGFAHALTAGFVAEIIFRGIVFRLLEQTFGSWIAMLCMWILFVLAHLNVPGASVISVLATSVQAGLLLSSAYMFTRSLWFTIFLHFAWDFAEPSIFGAINPGISNSGSLFSSTVTGAPVLTGGILGPQNSLQALIICLLTTMLFLWLAKRKNNFVQPAWTRH